MAGRFTLGWMQVAICFVFLACDSMITSACSIRLYLRDEPDAKPVPAV